MPIDLRHVNYTLDTTTGRADRSSARRRFVPSMPGPANFDVPVRSMTRTTSACSALAKDATRRDHRRARRA
jgi:hypothetical protein